MVLRILDLSSGHIKIFGNEGDSHTLRLSNPDGEVVIQDGVIFTADITSSLGKLTVIELDTSQIGSGILQIPFIVTSGIMRIRISDPQQTILTAEIEVK